MSRKYNIYIGHIVKARINTKNIYDTIQEIKNKYGYTGSDYFDLRNNIYDNNCILFFFEDNFEDNKDLTDILINAECEKKEDIDINFYKIGNNSKKKFKGKYKKEIEKIKNFDNIIEIKIEYGIYIVYY